MESLKFDIFHKEGFIKNVNIVEFSPFEIFQKSAQNYQIFVLYLSLTIHCVLRGAHLEPLVQMPQICFNHVKYIKEAIAKFYFV